MIKLPEANELRQVFSDLLGMPISAAAQPKSGIDPKLAAIGEYTGPGNRILAVADLAFANKAGAALTMIPNGEVERGMAGKKLVEGIYDNYCEVLNVLGGLFNQQNNFRLLLTKVYGPGEALPAEVSGLLTQPAQQTHFSLQVGKYGEGKFSILA